MSAETIKKFFNGHFFAEGKPQEVQMSLRFTTANGNTCEIPGINIWENTTIGDIFHTYHHFLKEKAAPSTEEKNEPAVERVISVTYRENEYLVQYYTDSSTKIRKHDGSFLNQDSPTGKAILKQAETIKK